MQTSLKPDEDYLDEDKPLKQLVKKQNFCVLSIVVIFQIHFYFQCFLMIKNVFIFVYLY